MAQTFFKVVTPQEALRTLLQVCPVGTERIPTIRARTRVLAEDLYSSVDLPHFHRAAMDGYAVRAKDTFGASQSLPAYLKLAGVVEMGKEATRPLEAGEAVRISTGGMMPPESDAVVMVEHTDETDAGLVEIHRGVSPWKNVIQIGDVWRVRAPWPVSVATVDRPGIGNSRTRPDAVSHHPERQTSGRSA